MQLFVACNTEKRGEPGICFLTENDVIDKIDGKNFQNENVKFCTLFNQLHVQRLVCMTVTPRCS